jgi:hypothetical protein
MPPMSGWQLSTSHLLPDGLEPAREQFDSFLAAESEKFIATSR